MRIIIFAGGRGSRLWPLSLKTCPKQLAKFEDSFSLLQKTLLRFLPLYGASSITIVTSQDYYPLAKSQSLALDPAGEISFVIEPCSKSTAPALALAIRSLEEEGKILPDDCILASPSDCFFSSDNAFLTKLEQSVSLVKQGSLVLFGITPSKVDTGFGYLKLGPFNQGAFEVSEFIEKPPENLIQELLLSKNVLWNSGHLAFTPAVFWEEMNRHCPEIALMKTLSLKDAFAQMNHLPSLSLDYGLLEKSNKTFVFSVDCNWLDIGSWDSLYDLLPANEQGNRIKGNVVDIGSKNCLFFAENRLLSTIDLEDLLVVETKEAILIVKKGHSQKVKQLAQKVDSTPLILEENESFKIQKIQINPGTTLHLQSEASQKNRLIVLKEKATLKIEGQIFFLKSQESVQIAPNTLYTLKNSGEKLLEVLQITTFELSQKKQELCLC